MKMPYEKWEYYRSLKYWKTLEAAYLLCGLKPMGKKDMTENVRLIANAIVRAGQMDSLKYGLIGKPESFDYFSKHKISFHPDKCFLKPEYTVHWAECNSFEIPKELSVGLPPGFARFSSIEHSKSLYRFKCNLADPSPNYNNSNSVAIDLSDPTLSDELKTALFAWQALYQGKEASQVKRQKKRGHKEIVENWIKQNCPKDKFPGLYHRSTIKGAIPKKRMDRITSIVNPDQDGGSVKTN